MKITYIRLSIIFYSSAVVGFLIGALYTNTNLLTLENLGTYIGGMLTPAALLFAALSYNQQIKIDNENSFYNLYDRKLDELKAIVCDMRLHLNSISKENLEPLNNLDKSNALSAMCRYCENNTEYLALIEKIKDSDNYRESIKTTLGNDYYNLSRSIDSYVHVFETIIHYAKDIDGVPHTLPDHVASNISDLVKHITYSNGGKLYHTIRRYSLLP